MINLYTGLESVEKENRKSLLDSLRNLSKFDADFSGRNGINALWESVDAKKFDSNMEYLIDKVKSIKNDEECIKTFFDEWIKRDDDYYHVFDYKTITENKSVIAISFAAVSEY